MEESKFINNGSEYMNASDENLCQLCINLISSDEKKCKAFDKIPDEIWEQEFIHTEKYKGQKNGTIFEKK